VRDRNQFREAWLQRHEAVAVVRQYLQCSIGKAEALIDRAVASGEVRTEQAAIQDFTCKTGNRVKAITRYSMDDLLALLNSGDDLLALLKPQIPQQQPPAKTTARTKAIREAAGRAITAIFGNRIPSENSETGAQSENGSSRRRAKVVIRTPARGVSGASHVRKRSNLSRPRP
jgi:hypothetical protein